MLNLEKTVSAARFVAVLSLVALVVLGLGWELYWAPIKPGGSLLALKVLPLCLPLAGLLKNRMYTYRWVSLMIWLYFIEGVVRGFSDKPPGNYLGQLEVVLCLLVFGACVVHVSYRLKFAKSSVAATQHASPSSP